MKFIINQEINIDHELINLLLIFKMVDNEMDYAIDNLSDDEREDNYHYIDDIFDYRIDNYHEQVREAEHKGLIAKYANLAIDGYFIYELTNIGEQVVKKFAKKIESHHSITNSKMNENMIYKPPNSDKKIQVTIVNFNYNPVFIKPNKLDFFVMTHEFDKPINTKYLTK